MKAALLLFVVLVSGSLAKETCDVVPLELWTGSQSGRVDWLPQPVNLIVVTSTETVDCYTDVECERLANNIRNNHIRAGLPDIALSFLIGGNGKIYEGAGWRVGGHTRGYNSRSISASFIGTFHDKIPTPEALAAARKFFGCNLNTRYLGCDYKLVGHRQLSYTSSPGDALQNLIESWPHWTADISNL